MRNLKIALWIILLSLFEAMFVPYIKIGNIMPDLLFVFALCYAVEKNTINSSIIVSAICGALADCFSGRIFGIYLVIFLICAVLIWIIKENIFKNSLLVAFAFIFIFSILGKSMYFVANISVLKDMGYLYSLFRIIIPEAIFNTFISILIIPLLRLTLKKRSGLYR